MTIALAWSVFLQLCTATASCMVPSNVGPTSNLVFVALNLVFSSLESGLNPYDARRPCDPETDGPLCYQEMGWVETYLNQPDIKAALGVNPQRKFESCNMAINQAFLLQGDSMHNTPALLPPLINDGVRLLVYAGNAGEWAVPISSVVF